MIDPCRLIGEIASTEPHATAVLDEVGIDYTMRGNLTLKDACWWAGLALDDVVQLLESRRLLPASQRHDWLEQSLSSLVAHLRDERHPALRSMLLRVSNAISVAIGRVPESETLSRVRDSFQELCRSLEPHMLHEEQVFFPVIEHLESCWERRESPSIEFAGRMCDRVTTMILEHVETLDTVTAMRREVETLRRSSSEIHALSSVLECLEHELREHMHLENNILYPGAARLEAQFGDHEQELQAH